MLHELLLALSGHPSPLLSDSKDVPELAPLLSASENALLKSIARLGNLHIEIRSRAMSVCSAQKSVICRAVSTAILSTHLTKLQEKIISVERSVLYEGTNSLGEYDIVPLSAIVGALDGWDRLLEWLKSVTVFMQQGSRHGLRSIMESESRREPPSGARLIDLLRKEALTGYSDIEQVSLDLIRTAESAWLRQISVWILYGRLPTFGADDFFIQHILNDDVGVKSDVFSYTIREDLYPSYVTPMTAHSISFVGKSINHIQRQASNPVGPGVHTSRLHESSMLTNHLSLLSSLDHPISCSQFSRVISSIRISLSRNTLQKLLPLSTLLQTLNVIRNFFLLERGEFAIALVTAADNTISSKHRQHVSGVSQRDYTRLSGVMMKEGEVAATLTQCWLALASLQRVDDDESDDRLDLARELISLSIKKDTRFLVRSSSMATSSSDESKKLPDIFDDVLLTTPTLLSINIMSPLDLFLTSDDVIIYSKIHAYLLSLRRIHLHLTGLWKLSILRRDPAITNAPNQISQQTTSEVFYRLRIRNKQRSGRMRKIWAMIGSVVFFLAEFGEYLQGEVVNSSWTEFEAWLIPKNVNVSKFDQNGAENPAALTSTPSFHSTINVPSLDQFPGTDMVHDPETLIVAHKRYLASLVHAILLDDASFTKLLRSLMAKLDYLVASMQRLSVVEQTLGLDQDHEVKPVLSTLAAEEGELMKILDEVKDKVDGNLQGLVVRLQEIDTERLNEGMHTSLIDNPKSDNFVPYGGGRVDRLLMKLDFITSNGRDRNSSR